MKKINKILVLITCIFFSITFVYAEEEDTEQITYDNVPNTQTELEKQNDSIKKYCDSGQTVSGCLYDKNNELYTTHKTGKNGKYGGILPFAYDNRPYTGTITMDDLKVLRAYQAFDGDGKAIYAACYRHDYNGYKESEHTGLGNGSYFIFDFITENKKGTCSKISYTIPSDGTLAYTYKRKYGIVGALIEDKTYEYNGKETLEGYNEITFNNWKATDKGDCPKVFGYTANTKWYTKSSNKYIFSEDTSDFNIETFAFFSGEKYVTRPGCTVDDESGEETNRQLLLSEIKTAINNYKCPEKIEDMTNLSNDLLSYYETLRNDNKYRVLWSHDLAEEVIKESETEINKYIKEKITSCQYGACNITSTEKSNITKNLGTACKNGCSINNYNQPSSDPNAKCYCCGGSQGCTYTWTEKPGTQCALQKDISMGLCIGTTKDLECRNCLSTAYQKAGLSEEKAACLIRTEILKDITEADLKDANSEAADESLKDEMEENSQIREEIFKHLIEKPDIEIYGGSMTCEQLLGPGLTKILNFVIDAVRIIGVIGTIVIAMIKLIPAVSKGDQSELNKAGKACIWSAVVLIIIVMLPTLIKVIGKLFGFDTSCIL